MSLTRRNHNASRKITKFFRNSLAKLTKKRSNEAWNAYEKAEMNYQTALRKVAETRKAYGLRGGAKHAKKSTSKVKTLRKVFKGPEFNTGINAVLSKDANKIATELPELISKHSATFSKYPEYSTLEIKIPADDEDGKLYYIQELRDMTRSSAFRRDPHAPGLLVRLLKDIFSKPDEVGEPDEVDQLSKLIGSFGLGAPNKPFRNRAVKPFRPLAVKHLFKPPKRSNLDDLIRSIKQGLSLGPK